MAINIRRSVTLGEMIGMSIVLFGCVMSFWINTSVRLAALELNQKNTEVKYDQVQMQLNKMNDKIDKMSEALNHLIGKLEK
jgi:TolA-binding protein